MSLYSPPTQVLEAYPKRNVFLQKHPWERHHEIPAGSPDRDGMPSRGPGPVPVHPTAHPFQPGRRSVPGAEQVLPGEDTRDRGREPGWPQGPAGCRGLQSDDPSCAACTQRGSLPEIHARAGGRDAPSAAKFDSRQLERSSAHKTETSLGWGGGLIPGITRVCAWGSAPCVFNRHLGLPLPGAAWGAAPPLQQPALPLPEPLSPEGRAQGEGLECNGHCPQSGGQRPAGTSA